MAQAILTIKGTVVPRRTVTKLTIEELNSPTELTKRIAFDEAIRLKLGDSMSLPPDLPLIEEFNGLP